MAKELDKRCQNCSSYDTCEKQDSKNCIEYEFYKCKDCLDRIEGEPPRCFRGGDKCSDIKWCSREG